MCVFVHVCIRVCVHAYMCVVITRLLLIQVISRAYRLLFDVYCLQGFS